MLAAPLELLYGLRALSVPSAAPGGGAATRSRLVVGDHAGRSDDLVAEIEAARHAMLGAAVTEIASFRAQLSGPRIG